MEKSIYVSNTTGKDKNEGTNHKKPLLTLKKALNQAQKLGIKSIKATSGLYDELLELEGEITLEGSYSEDFREKKRLLVSEDTLQSSKTKPEDYKDHTVLIHSSGNEVIKATPGDKEVRLSNLVIIGKDLSKSKTVDNSYVIKVHGQGLEKSIFNLNNVKVIAGHAAHGKEGEHGSDGAGQVSNGGKGGESKLTTTKKKNGVTNYGVSEDGKKGNGTNGGDGGKAGSGFFERKTDPITGVNITDGARGSNGRNGADGKNGLSAEGYGAFDKALNYINGIGKEGVKGTVGSGGGGGGAGGGRLVTWFGFWCNHDNDLTNNFAKGGTGGVGGNGGKEGEGGKPGESGRNTFGIVASGTKLISKNIAIVMGNGGNGGNGGNSGLGASGTKGSAGSKGGVTKCDGDEKNGGKGGSGGTGGHGGAGGTGGPGNGGLSVGIALLNEAQHNAQEITWFQKGKGGQGGQMGKTRNIRRGNQGKNGYCTSILKYS